MPINWAFPTALRYFENIAPALNTEKFWAYSLEPGEGGGVCIRYFYGRILTAGSRLPRDTMPLRDAQAEVERKVIEKLRKGYVERDESWVKKAWPQWRPPFVVDTRTPLPVRRQLRFVNVGAQPPLSVRPRVAVNPGRLEVREPVPARALRRVIDLTEE